MKSIHLKVFQIYQICIAGPLISVSVFHQASFAVNAKIYRVPNVKKTKLIKIYDGGHGAPEYNLTTYFGKMFNFSCNNYK